MKTELRFALTVLLFYALIGAGILLAGVVITVRAVWKRAAMTPGAGSPALPAGDGGLG